MHPKFMILRERRAATAIESSILIAVTLIAFAGMIELGWQITTEMALQSGASDAVRFAMTGQSEVPDVSGSPSCRAASIAWITIHTAPYILLADRLSISGSADGGAAVSSGTSGFGGAKSQVVTYIFTYNQPYLTPLGPMLAGRDTMTHTVKMLVQNEPYPTSGC